MSRKHIIAGNWKMNKTPEEGKELASEIASIVSKDATVEVVVCPAFVALERVSQAIESSAVRLGAQNLYPKTSGAFTGEVSPEMLRAVFAKYVILGHSERREYFHESDAFINEKVKFSLENLLKPILCIGETLEQREAGETLEVVKTQLLGGLDGVDASGMSNIVIAYEPVWAIGTGKTATPEMAQEVHGVIRSLIKAAYGDAVAEKTRIIYGGSMKPSNADELLAQPDIDGGLIGGASLDSKSFCDLIESARKLS